MGVLQVARGKSNFLRVSVYSYNTIIDFCTTLRTSIDVNSMHYSETGLGHRGQSESLLIYLNISQQASFMI